MICGENIPTKQRTILRTTNEQLKFLSIVLCIIVKPKVY